MTLGNVALLMGPRAEGCQAAALPAIRGICPGPKGNLGRASQSPLPLLNILQSHLSVPHFHSLFSSSNNTSLVQILICCCLDHVFASSLSLFQIILCKYLMIFYTNSNPTILFLLKIPLPVRQSTSFFAERQSFHFLPLPCI